MYTFIVLLSCAELLERAWGWDTIQPYSPVISWSRYMNYPREYYKHNAHTALTHQMEAKAALDLNLSGYDGDNLTTLFNLVTLQILVVPLSFYYLKPGFRTD